MGKHKISNRLNLFLDDTNIPVDNLMITAHGGYFSRPEFGRQTGILRNIPGLGGWIKVPPGTTLYFYGPHKQVLTDPGIEAVISSKVYYLEMAKGQTKVRNYRLSKFEEDTDELIASAISRNREFVAIQEKALNSGDENILDVLRKSAPVPYRNFDVLAIEERFYQDNITLHDMFKLLHNGFYYKQIHCVICRSPMFREAKSHNAFLNPGNV